MGLLDRLTRRASEMMFEEGQSSEPQETFSAEQFDNCAVEGDIEQTAKNMLAEAVKDLDQANPEDTIFKVKDCLAIFGEDSDASMVLKMLRTVAKKDPEVLKKDGEARIAKINGVMQMVDAEMRQTLDESAQRGQEILKTMKEEETSYTSDVDVLTKQCDEDIKALRDKLAKDIEARGQTRDNHLEMLGRQQSENDAIKNQAEALNREVAKLGTTQVSQIEKLLDKLKAE